MQTKTSQKSGFTLVEIMIVVAIIGLLAAIAIPNFIKAREKSQASVCISNMKQIEGANEQWATETHKTTGAQALWTDLSPDYIKTQPLCPAAAVVYVIPVIGGARPVCPNIAVAPTHILP